MQGLVAEAQPLHDAGAGVLDDGVGVLAELRMTRSRPSGFFRSMAIDFLLRLTDAK